MNTLLFGANGQLGAALRRTLRNPEELTAMGRAECDLSDRTAILQVLERVQPRLIINAAADTDVDGVERRRTSAFAVNAAAPAAMADWAVKNERALIHYSTEYVYDGSGQRPWHEEDPSEPLNVYGESKLEGDRAVRRSGAAALILLTAWLYDEAGSNFMNAVLQQAEAREEIRVVSDQIGAPTSAALLADTTLQILDSSGGDVMGMFRQTEGCVNVTATGATSRHGFAEAIVKEARASGVELAVRCIRAVSSDAYPSVAKRPLNSRLSLTRLAQSFGIRPPDWRLDLKAVLEARRRREVR